MNVYELSSAAGLPCEIDPALVVALSSQKSGETLFQHLTSSCCCWIDLKAAAVQVLTPTQTQIKFMSDTPSHITAKLVKQSLMEKETLEDLM